MSSLGRHTAALRPPGHSRPRLALNSEKPAGAWTEHWSVCRMEAVIWGHLQHLEHIWGHVHFQSLFYF